MTGVLDVPAVAVDAGRGGGPARRAVVRWAWRLFRREWRQQLLVLAMLTVAVAATILASAVGTNTPPPKGAGFGTANHSVTLPGNDANLAGDIAAIRQHFGTVDVIERLPIATGTREGGQLRAQDPHGAYGYPMLALDSGRYPTAPGEVAMTSQLASTVDVAVGGSWQQDGQTLRVVGIVENPQNLLDDFALVPPGQLSASGQLAARGSVTVLFDAEGQDGETYAFPGGVLSQTPQESAGFSPAVVVLAFTIFGLIFVGLVSVAGFSVLAQRRLRGLGMLSSLGATDRDVRLVMVANGAVVGVVAAVVGAVIGLAAWIAYAPHLQAAAHHRVVWTSMPWWLAGTAVILAVLTAILAARRPARNVARVPVMAALSGRPVPPQPTHRSALPGLLLLAAGDVMLAFSGGWNGGGAKKTPLQAGGILATAVGVLLLAPAAITLLGRLAPRLPVGPRLALRDLARYRARSGPALAAISLAVLVAVITTLLATGRYSDPLDYFAPNLPAGELVVYPPGSGKDGPVAPDTGTDGQLLSPAQVEAVASGIASSLGTGDVLAIQSAGARLEHVVGLGQLSYSGSVDVATPELLRHYGIDPATVDPTALVLTSRRALDLIPNLQLRRGGGDGPEDATCTPDRCAVNPKIQTLGRLPTGTAEPNLLVTMHAVQLLNLPVQPGGWLVRTAGPLTDTQINTARQAAAGAGMTIETRSAAPSLDQLRDYATAAGILLALAVLAMTVGLIRGEAAADLRTLTATGAAGRTRRAISASTAGAMGLTGALLGTGVAYLAVLCLFRSQLSQRMADVPVLDLVLVLAGLPIVAATGAWLLGGREPPAVARQPIE
jgi:putative ABC transport system permease protein